jgi:hypothetical protein
MHKTLKAETVTPLAADLIQQLLRAIASARS